MIFSSIFNFKGTILPIVDNSDKLYLIVWNDNNHRVLLNIITENINKFVNIKPNCKIVIFAGYYKPDLQMKVFYMAHELFDFDCSKINKEYFLFLSNYILNTVVSTGSIDCRLQFKNGIKLYIESTKPQLLFVCIIDNDKNEIIHEENIISDNIYVFDKDCFINYGVCVYNIEGDKIYNYNLDLKDKKVLIKIDKGCVGDVISRIPYIEEFRKKHHCDITCVTDWHTLFIKEYPNITFASVDTVFNDDEFFAIYIFENKDLQQDVNKCLGLEYKNIKMNEVFEHMKEISTINTI